MKNVRQHALSMLTDALIDNHGKSIPENQLYSILYGLSVPLAARRIADLLKTQEVETIWEEIMIELELCISLIFKPLLHHLRHLLNDPDNFLRLWKSILEAVALLLGDKQGDDASTASHDRTMDNLLLTTKELAKEHLRNAVMVLSASSIISGESSEDGTDISSVTWNSIQSMEFCKVYVEEWKQTALEGDENLAMSKENKSEGSHMDSEVTFEDLVIVSGEDTCESS